jgi:hypothetical protein
VWKKLLLGVLFVCVLFSIGGQTVKRGPSNSQQAIFVGTISDSNGIVGPPAYYFPGPNDWIPQGATNPNRLFIPTNKTFTVTSFVGVVEIALADDNEQCQFVLEWVANGAASTGAEIADSDFNTGDDATNIAANDNCDEGLNHEMSATGSICSITGINHEVPGGGWVRVKIDTSAGHGGAIDCVDVQNLQVQISGSYR